MRSSTSLALLSLVAGAVALGSSHDGMKRHQRMKKTHASALNKRSGPVLAYYGYQNGLTGSCGSVSSDTDLIVGLPVDMVSSDNTDLCGQDVTVTLADDSSTSVTAKIMDSCDCGGNIYLSTAAFKKIAGGSLDAGVLNVTWALGSGSSSDASSTKESTKDSSTKEAESATPEPTTSTHKHKAASSTKDAATFTPVPSSTEAAPEPESTSTSTKSKTHTKAATSTAAASTGGTSSDGWTTSQYLTGDALFDAFHFDSGASDNSGAANYVGRNSGLVYTDGDNNAIIAVDTTENVGLRNAVRMVSKDQLEVGFLLVVDVKAMPAGCGFWPAIWLNGGCSKGWPACGEIDIVEGVNLYTQNIMSIHTDSGCSIPESAISSLTSATLKTTSTLSCDANDDPTTCGFNSHSKASYGQPFNANNGGVYAVQVTADSIDFYFFERDDVPSDIAAASPTPSSWGAAMVSIPNSECNFNDHFQQLNIVINTNLGGTFSEGVWWSTGNGQETSCAEQTGFNSAFEYVTSQGHAFDSPWVIKSLAIYKQN